MTRNKQGDATATALVPQLSDSDTLVTLHSKKVRSDHSGYFGGNVLKKLLHHSHLGLLLPSSWDCADWLPGRWLLVPEVAADTSPWPPMFLQHPVGRLRSFILSVGFLFPSPHFCHGLSAIILLQKILSRHHWGELLAAFQSINGEWKFCKIWSKYKQLSSTSHMAMAKAQTGSKVSDTE